jgi:hypothetical protein
MANADYQVELREAITTVIPSLFQRLTDEEYQVRRETVETIGKLAVHSESRSDTTVAWLTQIMKSSFMKPLQP